MEPFRVGTDMLPFYMMSWNLLFRTVPFHAFTHEQFQTTASLSIHQAQENSWKSFPNLHMFYEALPKVLFPSKFFSYRQVSSVEFLLASFLGIPDENGSGCLRENFWFGSMWYLLSRLTSSGTTSGSVWNGSISSRLNVKPIHTVLVRFHVEPFPCKRGFSVHFSVSDIQSGNTYFTNLYFYRYGECQTEEC